MTALNKAAVYVCQSVLRLLMKPVYLNGTPIDTHSSDQGLLDLATIDEAFKVLDWEDGHSRWSLREKLTKSITLKGLPYEECRHIRGSATGHGHDSRGQAST